MGDINIMNLLSLESIPTLYGTRICYHGWVSDENRGWNYLRFKMDYYHWKTYFFCL